MPNMPDDLTQMVRAHWREVYALLVARLVQSDDGYRGPHPTNADLGVRAMRSFAVDGSGACGAPAAGQRLEVELPQNTRVFRFIKFEGARGSYGNVAEVFTDDIHLSRKGRYVVACVFHA